MLQRLVPPPGATIQGWDAIDAQLGVIAVDIDDAGAGAEVTTAGFQTSFGGNTAFQRWKAFKGL